MRFASIADGERARDLHRRLSLPAS
jgi:hypothetical protein